MKILFKSLRYTLILFATIASITGWSQTMDYLYDPSFVPPNVIGGSSTSAARVIVVHDDGRYLVGGSHQFNSQGDDSAINRFLPSGDLDPGFQFTSNLISLAYVIPYLDYYLLNTSSHIEEFNFDGSYNVPKQFRIPYMHPPYVPPTWPGPTSNWTQLMEEDGKLMVAGRFSPDTTDLLDRRHLIRVFSDGTPDTAFTPLKCHEPYDAYILDFYPTTDGKWMVAGKFTDIDGFVSPSIARLNEDFSVDTSFVSPFTSPYYDMRILPGEGGTSLNGSIDELGRVYVRHKDDLIVPNPNLIVSRLLPDGTIDTTFSQPEMFAYHPDGSTLKGYIHTIAFEPDGTIIIGGRFRNVDGHQRGNIAKLYEDGTVVEEVFNRQGADTANWQNGPNPTINIPELGSIIRLANGGLLVGGLFSRYDGVDQWGLVRLLPSPVGIQENYEKQIPISCFPNPASDFIHFTVPDTEVSSAVNIEIFDATGKELLSNSDYFLQQPMDISGLKPGLYNAVIHFDDHQKSTTRFVRTNE